MVNKLSKNIHLYIAALISLAFFISYNNQNEFLALSSLILIFLNNIIYSLRKIVIRVPLLMFNFTFFVFLMGKIFINYLKFGNLGLNYNLITSNHILICLFLSLLCLFLGFYVYEIFFTNDKIKINDSCSFKEESHFFMKYSLLFISITAIPYIMEILNKIIFVANHSYKELYSDYVSILPSVIGKLGTLFPFFLFLFLSCKPNKEKARGPLALYIFTGILSLGYGQRNPFVLNVLFVIVYSLYRNLDYTTQKKWISKRMIILGCICVPFIISFLFVFQSLRYNITSNTGIIESFIGFFESQGGSVEVIGETKNFEDQLPKKNYTMGPLIYSLNNNGLIHRVFHTKIVTPYTYEMASEGGILAHSLTYLCNPELYLNGGGMGSSYIAELYLDFSYVGVGVYNVLLGGLLLYIFIGKRKHVFSEMIFLLFMRSIFYLPRDTAIGFISNTFTITNIGICIVMYFCYILIKKTKKVKIPDEISTLVLLTNSFPYKNSETFLEPEIPYLKKFDKVFIIPFMYGENYLDKRDIDYDVINFKKRRYIFFKIKSFLMTFIIGDVWIEVIKLFFNHEFTIKRCIQIFSTMYHGIFYYCLIYKEIGSQCNNKTVFYSYWLGIQAVTAVKLNELYQGSKAISRAHGIDLYAYRNKNNYQSLRFFLLKGLDGIYFISQKGMQYFIDHYQNSDKLHVSYLGVNKETDLFGRDAHRNKQFHIVSCSGIILLKRVHLLIEALSLCTKEILWTHFGDGEMFNEIKQYAKKILPNNIKYEFKGQVSRNDIIKYYSTNTVDAFINTSEYEGLPVSIMEAISFGIPIIATNVGSVNEIVYDEYNGYLLDKNFDPKELMTAIHKIMNHKNIEELHDHAYEIWQNKFNAEKNYNEFINEIREMTA